MKRDDKKGQVTIFVIIGIVIVMGGILVYMFWPNISSTLGFDEESPAAYIQSCIEDEIEDSLDILTLQGGSMSPGHFIMYEGEKIEYLCYTTEFYKTCVMQQPMLQKHIETEINEAIKEQANICFENLEKNYVNKGYDVQLTDGDTKVELLPNDVKVTFDRELTLTKGEKTNHKAFSVIVNNNLYELVSIANSILNWEARYGDAETTVYMNYYNDLKVEKKKQSEGTTIYVLTNRDNKNKFQFASRSVAWPPGF